MQNSKRKRKAEMINNAQPNASITLYIKQGKLTKTPILMDSKAYEQCDIVKDSETFLI